MRVLSWNLYHGRDFPPDKALFTLRSRLLRVTERDETHAQVNRSLCREFTGWVGDCEWDVALLQEAPPLWFRAFRRRTASAGVPEQASLELPAAAASAVEWSEGDPLVFGGDLNLRPGRHPAPFAELRERFGLGEPTGPQVIDHLLARGLELVEPARQLAAEERELPERDGRRLRLS